MVNESVTVLLAAIPVRRSNMLMRALASITTQTRQPDTTIIAMDRLKEGSARTRNRALDGVTSDWVAFLDDDDEFMSHHLETLLRHRRDADVIYTGCLVKNAQGNVVPLREEWGRFGQEFDPDLLRVKSYLPVTSMVRTEVIKEARFYYEKQSDGQAYDDWGFYLNLLDNGARFKHVPQVTWIWWHTGQNTSGRPDRW